MLYSLSGPNNTGCDNTHYDRLDNINTSSSLSLSLTHTHTHTHTPPHTHRQSFSHNHTQTQSSIALGTYLDILQNGDDQVNRYRYARPLICKSNNLFVQLNDLVLWNLTSPTANNTFAQWIHKFMPTPVCCLFASAQWPLLYIINRKALTTKSHTMDILEMYGL